MLLSVVKILFFQIVISIIIIYFSKKLKLLDYPNSRKIHRLPVPFTGGLIISLTFLTIVMITDTHDKYLNLILSFSILICFSGLIDDKYQVNPGTKIILQFIPIFFLIDQDLVLYSLGKYEYLGEISLGSFNKVFTIFCCMLLINAFNYSDGIDGLLTSISIIILLNFIFLNYFFLNNFDQDFFILILLALVIFLFFNFGIIKNFKVFLGDSGSNLLGYVFAFISIYFYTFKNLHPVLIIWPLAYVVFEFLSVNIIRLIKNNAIFKAGNDHIHYELIKILKKENYFVLLIIISLNIFFSCIGFFVYQIFGADLSLIVYIITFLIYFAWRLKLNRWVQRSSGNSSGS